MKSSVPRAWDFNLRMFTGLLTVLLLCGCSGDDEAPLLRLGTNLWPGYEPFYLARTLDSWEDNEIHLVEYPSASEVLRAFRNKALEAAALTLDEALLLRQNGLAIEIILVNDVSNGGDVILARPPVTTFAELKNRRIGVENNALGAYMLTRALELNRMALADVQVVPVAVNRHESVYLDGDADAVVTFEPARSHLLAAGAQAVFSSREIPDEVVDVLVVHKDYAGRPANRARLAKLVRGWFSALDYLAKEPDKAAQLIGRRLKLSSRDVLASYSGLKLPDKQENWRMLGGPKPALQQSLDRLKAVMVLHRLLDSSTATDGLLNSEYLEAETSRWQALWRQLLRLVREP